MIFCGRNCFRNRVKGRQLREWGCPDQEGLCPSPAESASPQTPCMVFPPLKFSPPPRNSLLSRSKIEKRN